MPYALLSFAATIIATPDFSAAARRRFYAIRYDDTAAPADAASAMPRLIFAEQRAGALLLTPFAAIFAAISMPRHAMLR